MSNTPHPASHWRRKAKSAQWVIGLLQRRIDALEEELRELREGSQA